MSTVLRSLREKYSKSYLNNVTRYLYFISLRDFYMIVIYLCIHSCNV